MMKNKHQRVLLLVQQVKGLRPSEMLGLWPGDIALPKEHLGAFPGEYQRSCSTVTDGFAWSLSTPDDYYDLVFQSHFYSSYRPSIGARRKK